MTRLSILAALLLFVATPAHADGKHFLWRVSKGGDALYLAGSVHVLKPSDYPLPPVMEQAFSGSAGLVEEIDLASVDPESTQLDVLRLGNYPAGQTLQSALPPDVYKKVAKQAGDLGIDMAVLDNLKPWLVSITLLEAQLAKSGYAADDGADIHFANEAKAQNKPVTGLEQMEYQLGLLAGLPDQAQQALLLQAVDESTDFDTEMQQMISAWHTGDTAVLEKTLNQDFGGYPDIYKAVLVTRNQAWAPKLEALLASGKQYFVIVGALHLVGPDGLLARFKKDGYTVEQL
ncbi:MAG: TraB/GumN family protein [Gammaproteobacteria bacterium]|nr:TraB/GumN family protein [Gammaproteobacteria bacterium]